MPVPDPAVFNMKRDLFVERLKPIFLPGKPSDDIINYFASLLRVRGMEDRAWDPYAESRAVLNDLNGLFKVRLPKKYFKDPEKTPWRIGLLLYCHIVEMDAPYEVLTNLLRYRLGKGYSPNPFFDLLSEQERSNFRRRGLSTGRKIELIGQLSEKLSLEIGPIFDEFYDNRLRNAISHSDYILTETDFRCRGGASGMNAFSIAYEDLDKKLLSAKAFIAAFFQVELLARQIWGLEKQKALPYDKQYKGILEMLVDEQDVMCGFKVHWPNNSESTYRRSKNGIDMVNCMVDPERAALSLFVGLYARKPGHFSPLVEYDGVPSYTRLEGLDNTLCWPDD